MKKTKNLFPLTHSNFSNEIEKRGFDIVRKPKFMSDAVKVILGLIILKVKGAGIH